jgi:hypothetical protein
MKNKSEQMEKPDAVYQIEAFGEIYKKIRKETFLPYKEIVKARKGQLNALNRFLINHAIWSFLIILGSALLFTTLAIVFNWGSGPKGDEHRSAIILIIFLTQAANLFVYWRLISFKSSPTGHYRFYLYAKRLIEAYSDNSYSIDSLKLALDSYISDANYGVAVFTGIAGSLALYLNIDDAGFGGSTKALRLFFQITDPIDHGAYGRYLFFMIFAAGFLIASCKFYVPRVWAEQVKENLEHILKEDANKALRDKEKPLT